MPYKDKQKRYEAIKKSVAKKPEKYKALGLNNKRKASRRGYAVAWRYGITEQQYLDMVKRQAGICAICQTLIKPTASGRDGLYVDHNHTTGKVRALLCPSCNWLVGHYEKPNGAEIFYKVMEYIDAHSQA